MGRSAYICFAFVWRIVLKPSAVFWRTKHKIIIVLVTSFFLARILYQEITSIYIFFLVTIEYLLNYALSMGMGMLVSTLYGIEGNEFGYAQVPFVIYSALYYSSELTIVLAFRKFSWVKPSSREASTLGISQLSLYFCILFFFFDAYCASLCIQRSASQ